MLFIVRLWVRVDLHLPRLNKLGEFLHSILLLVNRQSELHNNDISIRTAMISTSYMQRENMDLTFASNV